MASSQSQKRPEIAIVSVGHLTEAYPNTFYKVKLLMAHYGAEALPVVFNLSKLKSVSGLRNLKASIILRFIINNIRAYLIIRRKKPETVYICYPGIVLAYLCRFMRKTNGPSIFLDAFISIYDTVVIDRKLIDEKSIFAKLLFAIEKRSYENCTKIIVDTTENAKYMASLFNIAPEKIHAVNLTIPPVTHSPTATQNKTYTCLFVGTFVPLQGIECIAQAAELLSHRTDIRFKIIGNGQDGPLLRAAMKNSRAQNIDWNEDWQSTEQIDQEIAQADICLGIFGTTAKANRVWPFKNYLYMAAGKPLITGDSLCARQLSDLTTSDDFMTCALGSASALADSITTLLASPQRCAELGHNARAFYDAHLSHDVALRGLVSLFNRHPA